MKKIFSILCSMLFALTIFMIASAAMAADPVAIPAPAGFEWLGMVLQFLMGIPKIGGILASVFAVVALVATVMTALSTAIQVILVSPEVMARFAGAHDMADKIKAVSDKVLPWLQYLSVYNVQKPKQ